MSDLFRNKKECVFECLKNVPHPPHKILSLKYAFIFVFETNQMLKYTILLSNFEKSLNSWEDLKGIDRHSQCLLPRTG